MMLSIPVMVSVDKREVFDLLLPGISSRVFRGVSLAELLDDVALHLMEKIPETPAREMVAYQFCPHIELRRVKVEALIKLQGDRKGVPWAGRLTVVVTRWSEDDFYEVRVPRLGLESFAVERTAYLEEGLRRFVEEWAKAHHVTDLDMFTSGSYEYLEILQVDTDLPTVLPSRPVKRQRPRRRRRKEKKKNRARRQEVKRQLVRPVTLREVGQNLTHRAIDGRLGQTFGREALVEQLYTQLSRDGAALLLVGPSGVGKTAIVHELVRRMAAEARPLHERREVWAVDGNRIIAGMSVVGAWEQRCEELVHELSARQDVLYVDDLPALVYTGRSAHSDTNVAEFLEPHLARGELRIIGECTPERLEAVREEAPGFFARFHVVRVPELDERQTLMALVGAVRAMEAREELVIEPETLEGILGLTRRFMKRRCHPGKAMELLEQVVTDYREVERDRYGRRRVAREKLVSVFSQQTGLPRFILWEQQARRHDHVLRHFARQIVAQPEAAEAVTDVVTVLQQGLNDPERPLGTFLFVGPTGVGKTETAKALAAFLFGSPERMIRFDMSEFRDPWSVTRLFGDRFRPDGELTRRVAQQPFSVVLFDEIEKADMSVFDALLQVLGEGRLTNAGGRTTDFCNTVIIMTSNLGVRDAERSLGFGEASVESRDSHYRKAAEAFFRPEFYNRIDRVVAFRALGREAMGPLVQRLLQQILGRRGLRRSGVLVQVEPELVELLVDEGFEPRYGARSLRRALEQRLTVPLARHLVSQPVDRTTLIHLFRRGTEIDMTLWGLEDRAVESWPRSMERRGDRGELRRRFDALVAELESIEESDTVARIIQARASLLRDFNAQDGLEVPQWARLDANNALLRDLKEVRDAIEDFSEEFLETYDFIERLDLIEPHIVESRGHKPYRAPDQLAVELDQERRLGDAWVRFEVLEESLADVAWQARVIQRPTLPLLIRFTPATDDPDALGWTLALAGIYREVWSRRADVQLLAGHGGGWHPVADFSAQERAGGIVELVVTEPGQTVGNAVEAPIGVALELRGPGLEEIVEAELGFHIDVTHSGPDMVLSLARIDAVGGEEYGDAAAHLDALDEAFERWCQLRRDGLAAGPHPRPAVPVVRRFADMCCEDAETDVEVDISNVPAATDALERIAVRRLVRLRRQARQEAAEAQEVAEAHDAALEAATTAEDQTEAPDVPDVPDAPDAPDAPEPGTEAHGAPEVGAVTGDEAPGETHAEALGDAPDAPEVGAVTGVAGEVEGEPGAGAAEAPSAGASETPPSADAPNAGADEPLSSDDAPPEA